MPSQDTVKASGFMRAAGCSSSSIDIFPSTALSLYLARKNRIQGPELGGKKFNDNGHMITIGVNFHF